MQSPTKEIPNRGEGFHRVGVTGFPLTLKIIQWLLRSDLGHRDQANLRKLGGETLEI